MGRIALGKRTAPLALGKRTALLALGKRTAIVALGKRTPRLIPRPVEPIRPIQAAGTERATRAAAGRAAGGAEEPGVGGSGPGPSSESCAGGVSPPPPRQPCPDPGGRGPLRSHPVLPPHPSAPPSDPTRSARADGGVRGVSLYRKIRNRLLAKADFRSARSELDQGTMCGRRGLGPQGPARGTAGAGRFRPCRPLRRRGPAVCDAAAASAGGPSPGGGGSPPTGVGWGAEGGGERPSRLHWQSTIGRGRSRPDGSRRDPAEIGPGRESIGGDSGGDSDAARGPRGDARNWSDGSDRAWQGGGASWRRLGGRLEATREATRTLQPARDRRPDVSRGPIAGMQPANPQAPLHKEWEHARSVSA